MSLWGKQNVESRPKHLPNDSNVSATEREFCQATEKLDISTNEHLFARNDNTVDPEILVVYVLLLLKSSSNLLSIDYTEGVC